MTAVFEGNYHFFLVFDQEAAVLSNVVKSHVVVNYEVSDSGYVMKLFVFSTTHCLCGDLDAEVSNNHQGFLHRLITEVNQENSAGNKGKENILWSQTRNNLCKVTVLWYGVLELI
jgi:hypothetical protein